MGRDIIVSIVLFFWGGISKFFSGIFVSSNYAHFTVLEKISLELKGATKVDKGKIFG